MHLSRPRFLVLALRRIGCASLLSPTSPNNSPLRRPEDRVPYPIQVPYSIASTTPTKPWLRFGHRGPLRFAKNCSVDGGLRGAGDSLRLRGFGREF